MGSDHAFEEEFYQNMMGKFVTAKLRGHDESRRGWVVQQTPELIIEGISGKVYVCEPPAVPVKNAQSKEKRIEDAKVFLAQLGISDLQLEGFCLPDKDKSSIELSTLLARFSYRFVSADKTNDKAQ